MAGQYVNSQGYGLGAQAVAYAARFLGVPYVWGGTTPQGFDCSGLTQFVYQNLGITLPRTSQEQATAGFAVSPNALQPGDLILYNEPDGPNSHVAIYAGNGQTIDAPHTGAVVRYDPVDWSHFAGARRVAGDSSTSTTPAAGLPATAAPAGLLSGLLGDPLSGLANFAITVPFVLGAVALTVIGLWQAFNLPKPPAVPIPV